MTRFIKASKINASGSQESILCEPNRFAQGRRAADVYLGASAKKPERQQEKIERLLKRMQPCSRAAQSVAQVSLAKAMQPKLLSSVAKEHIAAAQEAIDKRLYSRAEQELQVVDTLYAAQQERALRPDADVSCAVQQVRDRAAETRCSDLLSGAREAFRIGRFGQGHGYIAELESRLPQAYTLVSMQGRARLQAMRVEVNDLRLSIELAEDQKLLAQAEQAMRHGIPLEAKLHLAAAARRMERRPQGHPGRTELTSVRQAQRLCDDAHRIDTQYELLQRAQSRGDLRHIYERAEALHRHLNTLPHELPCNTPSGVLEGLRRWQPAQSKLPVFAQMLQMVLQDNVAHRAQVIENIVAYGVLEGPASTYSLYGKGESSKISCLPESYAFASMKARIAAESPALPTNTVVTLKMPFTRLYLHSCNYPEGLSNIIGHAPKLLAEYFERHPDTKGRQALYEALGFTCVEAQLTALQQSSMDPLEEDFTGKITPKQRSDEYLRVFHLKQIRAYAAVHGLNCDDHREYIDAKPEFMALFFNARTFTDYLQQCGFTQSVSPQELREVIAYQLDEVCVLGE